MDCKPSGVGGTGVVICTGVVDGIEGVTVVVGRGGVELWLVVGGVTLVGDR